MLQEEFYDGESVPFFGSPQGSFFKLCKPVEKTRGGMGYTSLISRRHAIHNIAKYLSRIY